MDIRTERVEKLREAWETANKLIEALNDDRKLIEKEAWDNFQICLDRGCAQCTDGNWLPRK